MDRKRQTALAKVQRVGEELRPARAAFDAARAKARPLIVEALDAGVQQKDIVEATGYTRENIRQIHRSVELERARKSGHAANA